MQTNTRLGVSLGQLLAGGGSAQARQAGMLDGMRQNQIRSGIALQDAQRDKTMAETDLKRRELELGSDSSLSNALLAGVGANSEQGRQDFGKFMAGEYRNPTQPLAFEDGGRELPAPGYVSQFPQLQQRFSTLKQAMALGDKNIEHIPAAMQGDQRNAITAQITPENASRIALAVNAIDGKSPVDITRADMAQQLAAGGDVTSLGRALLLSQGKGLYDSFNGGVTDVLSGSQSINDIGRADIRNTNAQAFQRNSAGNLNNANIGLTQARTETEQAKATAPVVGKSQPINNPLPGPSLKIQQEHLEAIGSASGSNQDLSNIRHQIETGTLKLGPMINRINQAKNDLGSSDESSRQYQTLLATLEKLRNDSLRLNKGVQTDGDAQRAWNELLTNLNDPKVVTEQMKRIEGYNTRAVQLRKALVSNLRSNFNAQPLDFSEFESPVASPPANNGWGIVEVQ